MKHPRPKTILVLKKILLLLPLLIGLAIVASGSPTQSVSAIQAKDQSIVPAVLPPEGRLFQSPLPTPTNTPEPATPTDTPEPATPTDTPEPATPTDTPEPATPTDTPEPATPTDTPEPATPTDTPEPATPTDTPFPNEPPQIIDITIPLNPVHIDQQPIMVEAVFTDPNPGDTHTARWDWGDGTDSVCPIACALDQIADEVLGSHTYADTGMYQVSLTVIDQANLSDTKTEGFVVVYDPNDGFVTGGGWIDSQAGAYKPDPTLSSKANFAFHSKYQKGASIPTGNTIFVFKAGDLNFHSDTYQWLVINQGGSNAQFKGLGTINGSLSPTDAPYSFLVWAKDDNPDTFRIKIWYETPSGEAIVYDNGFNQAIGGGSIVVHPGN